MDSVARTLAQVASVADVSRWYAIHLRGGAVVSVVMVRDTLTLALRRCGGRTSRRPRRRRRAGPAEAPPAGNASP